MKKKELYNLIKKIRKNKISPFLYANHFLDYNQTDYLYEQFFKKISLISYIKLFFIFLKNFVLYISIIFIKSNKSILQSIKKDNSKIVIIGHKINNSKSDFYFFKMINFLKSKSIKYKLYQVNHINTKKTQKHMINYYMNFKAEILLMFILLKSVFKFSLYLNKILKSNKNKFYLISVILLFQFSNKTAHNLRFPFQINEIIKDNSNLLNLFITFEGNHWERVLFGLLSKNKKEFNKINFNGLQHSYISSLNKNYFDFSNKDFNPSYILTSGTISDRLLKKVFTNTINIGTTKKNMNKNIKQLKHDLRILFLPSSDKEELEPLLKLLFDIHKSYPKYKIIWRNHPFLNSQVKNLLSNNPKIEVSSNNLYYDLKRSKLAFYTMSSSIIPAVCYGVRPIHLKNPKFKIDPLDQLNNSWKQNISNIPKIDELYHYEKNKTLLSFMEKSSKFYTKYFEDFKHLEIQKFIYEKV